MPIIFYVPTAILSDRINLCRTIRETTYFTWSPQIKITFTLIPPFILFCPYHLVKIPPNKQAVASGLVYLVRTVQYWALYLFELQKVRVK